MNTDRHGFKTKSLIGTANCICENLRISVADLIAADPIARFFLDLSQRPLRSQFPEKSP